jgi:hypothetical protein
MAHHPAPYETTYCLPTKHCTLKHAKQKATATKKSAFYTNLLGTEGRWWPTVGYFILITYSQVRHGKVVSATSIQAILVAPPSDLVTKCFSVGYHREECNV